MKRKASSQHNKENEDINKSNKTPLELSLLKNVTQLRPHGLDGPGMGITFVVD